MSISKDVIKQCLINKQLMMCINGFKDAVVNHKETILKFLWQ